LLAAEADDDGVVVLDAELELEELDEQAASASAGWYGSWGSVCRGYPYPR
jgi:hypothetical protein